MVGAGVSKAISQPESGSDLTKKKRQSWVDEAEPAEISEKLVDLSTIAVSKSDPQLQGIVILPLAEKVSTITSPSVEIPKGGVAIETLPPEENKGFAQANSGTTPWLDIVRGNRFYGNGLSLEYIPPGEEVIITDEEWDEGEKI